MTFDQLIQTCNPISVSGSKPTDIGTLTQDSRSVQEQDVFIAVKGTRVDGHQFISDAIDRGAAIVISEQKKLGATDVCIIQVADTRALVGRLAQAFAGNPAEKLTTIGITGTNGKTTVATLTYQILQKLGATPSLLGTVAKHIGNEVIDSRLTTADPIELASDMRRMVKTGSNYLVMEVSSHALDQQRVNGIDFRVAAFTNLSHDHLDYHSNIDSYACAKKRLFDELSAESTAVINADDDYGHFMMRDCIASPVFFGFTTTDGVPCSIEKQNANGLQLKIGGTKIESPLIGRFNTYNIAQVFLICRALGFNETEIATALQSAKGAPGRLERVQLAGQANQPIILVDYAHTPAALENVLQSLRDIKEKYQILYVVFGCGGDRDKKKRSKMAQVAETWADHIIITSDNPRSEGPERIIDEAIQGLDHPDQVSRLVDRRKAIEQAILNADPQTIVLIAGKGHETYQEIKGQRHPFDDCAVAREALRKRNEKPEVR